MVVLENLPRLWQTVASYVIYVIIDILVLSLAKALVLNVDLNASCHNCAQMDNLIYILCCALYMYV